MQTMIINLIFLFPMIGNSMSLNCLVCGTSDFMSTCDSTLTPISQTASEYSVCWRFDEICVSRYRTGYAILWWGPLTSNCNFTKTVSYGDLTCVYAYTCCSSNDCNNKTVITAPTTIATTPDTTTITSTAQENSTINPIHFFLLLSLCTFFKDHRLSIQGFL